jgi:hypothetical protein
MVPPTGGKKGGGPELSPMDNGFKSQGLELRTPIHNLQTPPPGEKLPNHQYN